MKKQLLVTVLSVLVFCWSVPAWAGPLDSDAGASSFASLCASCHGSSGAGASGPALTGCGTCGSIETLYSKIDTTMPKNNASACTGTCAENTAAYIFEDFNGNTRYTVYIPHITADYSDWTDYLQADNNASARATVHIALYSGGTTVYSGFETIPGRGETTPPIDLKSFDSSAETGVITFYEQDLNFRFTTVNSGGGIAEFSLFPDLLSRAGFYFTDFEGTSLSGSIVNKGLAVANMTDATISLVLYAVGNGGIAGTSETISLGPWQKALGTHQAWFPQLSGVQVKKIIAVTSAPALQGIVISSDQDLSHLLFTPGTEVNSFP